MKPTISPNWLPIEPHKAYAESAVTEDATAASLAIQASTAMQSFPSACKSKSQTEREMFFGIWDLFEKQATARIMELEGYTHLRLEHGESIQVNPAPPRSRAARRAANGRAQKRARR